VEIDERPGRELGAGDRHRRDDRRDRLGPRA
jgi:hypothetical protein